MESGNESRIDEEGKSLNDDESVTTTPSTLLNRKGLFGNSASRLSSTFAKEPTPESPEDERKKQNESVTSTPLANDVSNIVEGEEGVHEETGEEHNSSETHPHNSSSEGVSENVNIHAEDVKDDEENVLPASLEETVEPEETAHEPAPSPVADPEPEPESEKPIPDAPTPDEEEPAEEPSENPDEVEKDEEGDQINGDEVEEEVFVKKNISMDTEEIEKDIEPENEGVEGEPEEPEEEYGEEEQLDRPNSSKQEEVVEEAAEEKEETQNTESAEEGEEKEEDDVVEPVEEEEEEEVPKKRAKRTGRSAVETEAEATPARSSRSRRSAAATAETPEVKEEEVKTTPPKRGRGRKSQVEAEAVEVEKEEAKDEELVNGDEKEEEEAETEVKTEPRGRARRSAVQKEEKEKETKTPRNRRSAAQKEEETPVSEEKEETVEKTPRSGRARRSAVAAEEKKAEPEVVEKTPKSGRGRRSAAANSKTPIAKQGEEEIEENPEEEVEEEQEDKQKTPAARRGKKSKAADNENDTSVAKTPATEGRRSTRTRAPVATPQATPKSAVKTPSTTGRGRKKAVSITEPVPEEDEDNDAEEVEVVEEEKTPKRKRGRATSAKSTPAVEVKTPSNKKKHNEDEYDPYDMDTEMEKHPEPLKNIHLQMEVQNFGSVKYAKVGSASKYELTEKAAESRVGNLTGSTPQRKERKSLAEMAPGKEKTVRRSTGIAPASARKGRGKKAESAKEEEDMEVDVDADEEEKIEVEKTPKGRKRKSEVATTTAVSAKKASVELPTLTSEEQWKVDHPEDEHEPHAPGARIYAIFDKVYYPAVIATERDGLGRFKVQFTADKIVKDVPSAGIIPLRVVVSGKQCFHNDDVMTVLACPNAASADEWTKGVFELEGMDEEGNPNGDVVSAEWSTISLDMNDWRDFINKIASQATAIVTDNITTPSQMSRARKTKLTPMAVSQPAKAKPKPAKAVAKKVAKPAAGRNDVVHLTMSENGVGKDIFSGKIFMLTSANRQTPTHPSDPFRKKNLQEFIEMNGGIVTEHFEDFTSNSHLQPMLISDTPFRTHKYLAALARGLPCVSNKWLKACGDEGECVDFEEYLLSAGNSIFDNQPKPAPKNPSTLLSGKCVYVHSTHVTPERTQSGPGATFIDIWKPIIKLIGGETLDVSVDDITDHEFDFLVTDNTCADHVREHAQKIGAPLVTSEWVIQTIINSGPPSADSHPKFTPSRFYQQ